jgi:phosphonate transport system substrate-binding protein
MHKALFFLFLISISIFTSVKAETYIFGVTPWQRGQSEDQIKQLYKPMLEWLEKKTGHRFIVVSTNSYRQMIDYTADGTLDFASISPVPYILAKQQNKKLQIILIEQRFIGDTPSSFYKSLIISRRDNEKIKTINDLKNKKFGFVSKQSTSGFLYPMKMFIDANINISEYFKKIYFLGSHPRVTDAVKHGSIDAGASWTFNYSRAQEKYGDIFRILWESPDIPNLAIVANNNIPKKDILLIKKLLINIDPKLLKGIPADAYISGDDSFYDGVRDVLKSVNAN